MQQESNAEHLSMLVSNKSQSEVQGWAKAKEH